MKQNFLGIEQKKGSSEHLRGKLVAYARVTHIPQPNPLGGGLPFDDIIQNGILAVIGDYTEEKSLKEFIQNLKSRQESGTSLHSSEPDAEGHSELDESEEISGLLQDLTDSDEFTPDMSEDEILGKLEEMTHVEVIPVPARIGHFESEEEILAEDADVFYLGEFNNAHNAQLSTTTFPIMYQSAFKEQESKKLNSEIDQILDDAEHQVELPQKTQTPSTNPTHNQLIEIPKPQQATQSLESLRQTFLESNYKRFEGDLEDYLYSEFAPLMIHNLGHHEGEIQLFRRFMEEYPFAEDLERFEALLPQLLDGDPQVHHEFRLYCQKFNALKEEQFELLQNIQEELSRLA